MHKADPVLSLPAALQHGLCRRKATNNQSPFVPEPHTSHCPSPCLQTYVSPEVDRANCKATGGNNSQGAIYKVPNALGPQFLSTLESAPMTGFGGSQRPSMATKSGFPGPGAYKVKPGVGEPCSQVQDLLHLESCIQWQAVLRQIMVAVL